VQVSPSLIKRSPSHFHELNCGVLLIIGNNGFIWIYPQSQVDDMESEQKKPIDTYVSPEVSFILIIYHYLFIYLYFPFFFSGFPIANFEMRLTMARIRNAIVVLSSRKKAIHPDTIMEVFRLSEEKQIQPKEMMYPDISTMLVSKIQ
jgi:exosome complex component RRP4